MCTVGLDVGAVVLGLRRHQAFKFKTIEKFNSSSFQYQKIIIILADAWKNFLFFFLENKIRISLLNRINFNN